MGKKEFAGILALVFFFFALSDAFEISHPIEETPHPEHQTYSDTSLQAPLPCEQHEHPSHGCLHSQKLTQAGVGVQPDSTVAAGIARRGGLPDTDTASRLTLLLRGPPSFESSNI